jgi:adenylate kinase family enzyme
VKRVLVIGCCGSGKSWFARALAQRVGAPWIELDALHHGPGWMPRPEFAADVTAATQKARWVIDGNYGVVRDLLWSRAEVVVWLDLPLWVVEWRVVRRSLIRWARREVLWNGNHEPGPWGWIDKEHPIRWAWKKHPEYRKRYAERFANPAFAHLARFRLRSPAEVRNFLVNCTPERKSRAEA